ncbi:stage III sporulation protein AG [Natribacillus halophilus]|uniref:Stage III sporulation protein AG n=1 Tax=Natribacillus halophilus TaxID=549003 RepID=A0A1G8JKH1_9BACI|nr:stage III sporulation protein AG [Natribacillus halophilus]SDI31705.1 stage III sporulation protein AG [Natribacillus halophilus]
MSEKPPFSKWLPSGDGSRKFRWYYLGGLLLVGIFLMFVGTTGGDDDEPSDVSSPGVDDGQEESVFLNNDDDDDDSNDAGEQRSSGEIGELERAYASELEGALESMSGLSGVEIVVNLEASESKVYEKDTSHRQQTTDETDTEGGDRTLEEETEEEEIVLVPEGDSEEPLLIRTERPEVSGVLVVADGVDQLDLKESVIEAVTRTLDVEAHRVSVVPK